MKRRAAEELGFRTAEEMVELTRQGAGKADAADRRPETEVDGVYEDIASVTARAVPYHEYLHLVRTKDGWKTANVLYRPREQDRAQ